MPEMPKDPAALVDVAHESRSRRWEVTGPSARGATWARLAPGGGSLFVGHGRSVRVATLDAQAGTLEQSTRRAVLAAGAELAVALTSRDPRPFGERAQALRDAEPSVVLVPLVGGSTERLALLTEPLRFGCAAQRPRPRVLLAGGDERAVARAAHLLAPFEIETFPDVRTDDGRRRVVSRLRELRREHAVLRDEVLERIARGIADVQGAPAVVVDVTGMSTSIVRAEPHGPVLGVHARPLGIGRGADRIVARGGLDRVRRWIPWSVDPPTLLERVFNRARWTDAAPSDRETLALETALAHEAIGHALSDAAAAGIGGVLRSGRAILLTGHLATLPAGAATLAAIDALGPAEPASIARDDREMIVAVAAAGMAEDTGETLSAAIGERAVPVAAVIPVAASRPSTVRILSGTEVLDERVERGRFARVHASGEIDVSGVTREPVRLAAGSIGVVIDARRRPLALPLRDAERVPVLASWYAELEAMPA